MAFFRDEREVYVQIGGLLRNQLGDEELSAQLNRANTIVRYEYRDPESQITVKMLDGEPGQVDCGPSALEPEVIVCMDADTAHRFWLGRLNLTVALARGQMRARGPVAKLLKVAPALKPMFARYRAQIDASGEALSSGVSSDQRASPQPH